MELFFKIYEPIVENAEHIDVLTVKFKVTKQSLTGLFSPNWLSDEIINVYLKILERDSNFTVRVVDTFWYNTINKKVSAKRLKKDADIFIKRLVLIPIHLGIHWCLCAVDNINKSITYYDSLHSNNDKCLEVIENYLQSLGEKRWSKIHEKNIVLQTNLYDCGVYTYFFAKQLIMSESLQKFSSNMNDFRIEMLCSILSNCKAMHKEKPKNVSEMI
ncbi:hypothetical protein KQX54_013387 [Cotesia glomerata]|uniref:Ubiquitin-like protease family profile domain-containing protein n=1 Tax=Cotesia glomerata TaxID=32391 RepID=A0AAV7I2E6_COTGL|nr:hypothetical protein KQX54_013387 [Cotesia glomerata]